MSRLLGTLLSIVVVAGSAFTSASGVHAANVIVCPSGPPVCGFTHIQDAINAAQSGDTVIILPGRYREVLTIPTSLSLWGSGTGATTVDGGRMGSVVSIG